MSCPAREHARDDRQRELRPPGRAPGPGVGAHQQVRRVVPGSPLLRRLRRGRRRRADLRSIARRSCSAPSTRTSSRTPVPPRTRRDACAGQSRRQADGPLARARRPPHPRDEDQLLRPLYEIVAYETEADTGQIDMDKVRELAVAEQPKVIVAGWSAYTRQLDFAAFREIADEVGAFLWTDMAHFAGLVAADCTRTRSLRGCGLLHGAQDPRRPPLRHDPLQGRTRARRSTLRSSPASRAGR